MSASYGRRKVVDLAARGLCIGATLLAVVPLVSVLVYVAGAGLSSLSLDFFTELPKPVGELGGGMKHAIIGTLILVGLACAVGIPLGLFAGIYLAEFGDGPLGRVVRFSADVMSGVPSIIIGTFVYVLVLIMQRFSALAGGVALGLLMLPTITRTTEELLRLVPASLREAGLALGVPRWRVTLRIVLVTAAPGIATGVMLAVARVAGETAPLLFTALGNRYLSTALDQPISALSLQIYQYAGSPYDDWHRQASAAALVLVAMVLVLNIAARVLFRARGEIK